MPNVINIEAASLNIIRKDDRTYLTFRAESGDEFKVNMSTERADEALEGRVIAAVEASADALQPVFDHVKARIQEAEVIISEALAAAAGETKKALHIKSRRPRVEIKASA